MSGKTSQNHRVAVVTGGAGGIGGAIVERLAPDHTVVVLDRTGDFVVDLSDPDDVRRAAKLVLDRHSRCDVFVHAAATSGSPCPNTSACSLAWEKAKRPRTKKAP